MRLERHTIREMSRRRLREDLRGGRWVGNTGAQRHVRAPTIVVGDVSF